jgi:hypothetical protein
MLDMHALSELVLPVGLYMHSDLLADCSELTACVCVNTESVAT